MKHLFITGGTGFFGKSILAAMNGRCRFTVLSRNPEHFLADNPQFADMKNVSWLRGDVRNFDIASAANGGPYDAMIHAATPALTTIPDSEMTSIIIDGTRHAIDFMRAVNCRKVLFTSSGAVYGPQTIAVDENAACKPVTAYGKGKLKAEQMLTDAGLEVKVARCFAFVGPYLNRNIHYAIGNFMRDALDGRDIVVNGDGTPMRSYLYADDLVEWLFAIMERGESGRVYNVGSDVSISIRDLAETVRRVLNPAGKVRVLGAPSDSPPSDSPPSVYVPDVSRAKTELGLRINRDLVTAIRNSAIEQG